MLRNYIKVAIRNLARQKIYSILNIVGLMLGLTACFLVGLYILDELSFDKFHYDAKNIHRVALHGKIAGQEIKTNSTCPPLSQALVNEVPGVEHATRLNTISNLVIKYDDKAFTEAEALYADSNFFEFFSFELEAGDVKTSLKEPNTVVMTASTAKRYFGDENAIGKIVTVGNENRAFSVTGIVKEPPTNSHIQFELLLSSESDENMKSNFWTNNGLYTYYRINPLTAVNQVDDKLKELVLKYVGPEIEEGFGMSFKDFEEQGGVYGYYSVPFLATHLYTQELDDDITPKSDVKYVYIIGAVGLFILVIACINFMNLSTARSAGRAKEVGLRKTLGSVRSALIGQFLSESFIYVILATTLALGSVYLLLPAFNILSGKELTMYNLFNPTTVSLLLGVVLLVGFLAGSYPAFYLTAFNPVDVLKGKVRSGVRSKGVRSTLVVVQFAISITLIICTLVVFDQLTYIQERNIGLDKKNVLILRNTRRLTTNMEVFREKLSQETGIVGSSYTNNAFPGVNNTTVFQIAGTEQNRIMGAYYADYNQLDVLKIDLVSGRYFSPEFLSDSTACVINEAAVKELGWTDDPINQKLTNFNSEEPFDMRVIGVMKDFNFESFKSQVRPLVLMYAPTNNNMLIRYEGNSKEMISKVELLWKEYAASDPFEFAFLDQGYNDLFKEEEKLSELFTVLTSIAIVIACLGLFGLASFTAEQRTKEIGIRKVMGASVTTISSLLSKEFMILVGIAFGIASVLAWYFMDMWLESFAFRIELSLFVFIIGGAIAVAIAWFTISFHFIKAARSNPTTALRYE